MFTMQRNDSSGDLMSSECAEWNAGCRARNVVSIRDSRIATPQQVGTLDDLRLDARAIALAIRNQAYRDQFLASIRDRLGTAAVKGQALDLCQELFSRRWRAL